MIRTMVIGNSVHSGRYPHRAPAWEYVMIPPASLSTTAVINPGPRMPKKTASR